MAEELVVVAAPEFSINEGPIGLRTTFRAQRESRPAPAAVDNTAF